MLADNAVIPLERTQIPMEWDDLRNQLSDIITELGPTPEQPKGPFGDALESFANGLDGKGKQINTTLTALSNAVTALNEGRGDFFAVAKSLALFVNALHNSDQQFVALRLAGNARDLAVKAPVSGGLEMSTKTCECHDECLL